MGCYVLDGVQLSPLTPGYGPKTPWMPENADSIEPCGTVFSIHTLLGQGLTSQPGTGREEEQELIIQ